jgi:hypothetical protein
MIHQNFIIILRIASKFLIKFLIPQTREITIKLIIRIVEMNNLKKRLIRYNLVNVLIIVIKLICATLVKSQITLSGNN